MRPPLIVISLILYACVRVSCKNNVKSLTESGGQEVIEIGAPAKGLPADIEEEPPAEFDDEERSSITTQTTTKKEMKKTTTVPETRKKGKDIDVIDGLKPEDEEARIEKELAEIYKDNIDYKDSSESIKEVTTTITEDLSNPALRQRNNFKFQPDLTNKAEVERFRTSVDDISCSKVNKLTATPPSPSSGRQNEVNLIIFNIISFSLISYMRL